MTKAQFIIYTLTVIIGGSLGIQVSAYMLDQATIKQCRTHDWPKAADNIHKKWCVNNGYKI